MSVRTTVAVSIFLAFAVSLPAFAAGFTITITFPADGAFLGSRLISVNGSCSDPAVVQMNTSTSGGFANGTRENLTSTDRGGLTLRTVLEDDFAGPPLDGSKWTSRSKAVVTTHQVPTSVSISGGPAPGPNDNCMIKTVATRSFNPTQIAKTFTCRATFDSGSDWMGMLIILADDGSFAGITWGVGADYGGEDNVACLLTWVGNSHPYLKGPTLVPGRFYEFKLAVEPAGTVTGYYRADGADTWSQIASASYGRNTGHSLLLGRPLAMGGGGGGYTGRMTADWVREEGPGGFFDDFDGPELELSLWTSQPAVAVNAGLSTSVVDISGGPSPGEDDFCRIESKAPYLFNPVRESRTFQSRATKLSGNDWMGMIMIRAADGSFAGISWGVGQDYGGEDDVVCLVTWVGDRHPYLKGPGLTPGVFYEFRLVCTPGTVSGYYRSSKAEEWSAIASTAYQVDQTHSVLFGRPAPMGGGGKGYTGDMLLDWVREEGRSALSGEYVSGAIDTNCTGPDYLGLAWEADAPPGASVELHFRSSAIADMSGADDWSPLNRGQAGPGVGLRYCQFRAVLQRNDTGLFPVLDWVSLRYTGIQSVKLTTDGSRWTDAVGTSSWEAALGLADGSNTITAAAVDCAGNRRTAETRVVVDTTTPSLRILGPAQGERIVGLSVPVRVEARLQGVAPVRAVLVSPDGLNWTACKNGTEWTAALKFTGYGNRTVYARAVTAAGQTQSASVDVVLQTTPPAITILKPLESEKFDGRKVTVNVQSQAAEKSAITRVEASPDGTSWVPCAGGAVWAGDITFKSAGRKTLFVRAFDDTGNSATAQVNLTIKQQAPSSTPGMELPLAAAAFAVAAVTCGRRLRPRR